MSLGTFGLSKVAQKDGSVVLSDAFVADAFPVAMETFSAGVGADLPKMFPAAAELQLVAVPPLLPPLLFCFSKAISTSVASSL